MSDDCAVNFVFRYRRQWISSRSIEYYTNVMSISWLSSPRL